ASCARNQDHAVLHLLHELASLLRLRDRDPEAAIHDLLRQLALGHEAIVPYGHCPTDPWEGPRVSGAAAQPHGVAALVRNLAVCGGFEPHAAQDALLRLAAAIEVEERSPEEVARAADLGLPIAAANASLLVD